MSSNAYTTYLDAVLKDADELLQAHSRLRTGTKGRQWGLGAINRAVVVMSAAAWEAYIEEVVKECVEVMRPAAGPVGTWPTLNAQARSEVGRFNNPNSQNVRTLIANALGLSDVTDAWAWQGITPVKAVAALDAFLKVRHQVAHGVHPRPVVHNQYAAWLLQFVRRLAVRTDAALSQHLTSTLGVTAPW